MKNIIFINFNLKKMSPEKISTFPYAANSERYEKWEEGTVKVLNPLEELGLPSMQKIEGEALTPNKTVDIDDEALRDRNCPFVVFGRPHAGEFVPQELWEAATEEGKKSLAVIDRGTNDIFKSPKVPSVGTKMSRFIIDPNRPPLLGMAMDNKVAPGEVLWYKGVFGEEIYQEDKKPTKEKVQDMAESFYLPYHNGMMATVGSLADRRTNKSQRILVIDGHSFPISNNFQAILNRYGIKNIKEFPLFIIGDKDGKSCDTDIRNAFIKALEDEFNKLEKKNQDLLLKNSESGRIVGVNEFLKGAHNVDFYGQRREGINAIQLEINEGMFVDEKEGDYFQSTIDRERVIIVKKMIEKAALAVDSVLKGSTE